MRTVRELADAAGLPLPSAHRYVALLRDEGLVAEGARGAYHLTVAVGRLARAARSATGLVDTADPVMRQLSGDVEETVLLAQLVHGRPVCIHRVESRHRLRLSFEPGQELPPLSGASVKVLVGMLGAADQAAYLERVAGVERTAAADRFLRDVERARSAGVAESSQEIDEGVWAVAAPVYDGTGGIAALSIACPAVRTGEGRRRELEEQVRTAAARVSAALRG